MCLLTRRAVAALSLAAAAFFLPAQDSRAEGPVSIEDNRGAQVFESTPKRVIALNWALAEQIIELGVPLVGIADIEGYKAWVAEPAIPDGVADLGKRESPNLERLLSLQPDLLLLGGQQGPYVSHLEPIGRVLQFELFSETHDNAATVRKVFLDLGRLFGREKEARTKLAAMDTRLGELKQEIATAYPEGVPKVTLLRFIDDKRVVVSGANGLPEAAMDALGIETGYPVEKSRWGIGFKAVTALAGISEGYVVHMEPFPQGDKLFNTTLWQEMPFVKAGHFRTIPPLWTYGGALSIGRIAEQIAKVLLAERSQ